MLRPFLSTALRVFKDGSGQRLSRGIIQGCQLPFASKSLHPIHELHALPQIANVSPTITLIRGFCLCRAITSLPPPTTPTMVLTPLGQQNSCRGVTKFSLNKGKRKSVKTVLRRFKRLHWGGWIRTYTGRHKKLFKKSARRRHRLRQHVFVNSTQSWLLDKMVTKFWRRPKHWVDDPYTPYHRRDEFFATKGYTFKV